MYEGAPYDVLKPLNWESGGKKIGGKKIEEEDNARHAWLTLMIFAFDDHHVSLLFELTAFLRMLMSLNTVVRRNGTTIKIQSIVGTTYQYSAGFPPIPTSIAWYMYENPATLSAVNREPTTPNAMTDWRLVDIRPPGMQTK